ncbi:MAG TPA: LrgB family protein [Longimicrobiaceae bacterium]|nr:LrgB family protein [Longimicrobiaceae bacterium]
MAERVLSAVLAVAATVAVFTLARRLHRRLGWFLLHPVLVAIVVLIAGLRALDVPYAAYDPGGRLLSFFLGPAVVALGVPLYRQLGEIRRNARATLVALAVGGAVGILSACGVAALLSASPEVVRSLAPRSVTTPIAIEIARRAGGLPSLSAVVVILSGVLGAAVGPGVLRAVGVRSRTATGIALGASAHGIGTARAVEEGEVEAAGAGIAIGLMGVATAVLTPGVLALLAWLGALG